MPRDPRVRFALGVVAALVAFGIVLAAIDRLAPQPKGPKSSSYATSPQGLAAYAALLERNGRPVRRLRTAIADQPPRDGETLVVLDPQALEPKETRAIGKWVKAGGHLVAGGAIDASWLDEVLEKPPEFEPGGELDHDVLAPIAGVNAVRSAGNGAWTEIGGALPVIGPRRRAAGRHRPGGGGPGHVDRRRLAAAAIRVSRAPTTRRSDSPWPAMGRWRSWRPSTATASRAASPGCPQTSSGRCSDWR